MHGILSVSTLHQKYLSHKTVATALFVLVLVAIVVSVYTMNQSNSTATAATTGPEDHGPSPLHVGVVFGIVIIGIVLIVTVLLLLCKNIDSTFLQKVQVFRHRTNRGRKKSRSVVNHGTGEKRKVSTSSRTDFQPAVGEQKLSEQNENQGSFAQHKVAVPDEESRPSLQIELLPA